MVQVFEHYTKWEDWKAGMFSMNEQTDSELKISASVNVLSSPDLFYDILKDVLQSWPISSAVNLTNKQQNRKAWLGAAACMFSNQAPEYITRIAWSILSEDQQKTANMIAGKIISEYENTNNYAKTLFE